GPPRAAVLDAQATWRHASAVVTVTVTGPVREPTVRLSSEPPMDEAAIAFLIATGRTSFEPGATTSGGALTATQAGEAAAGAIATQLLDDVLLKQLPLPVDTVALDTGGVRAGTYLNDRVYVGYTRRFDAQPTHKENQDEFRVEYQITPRWTLEGQVGDQRSSGSLIWSKNY
ncbi:MAG TPA: translocation/assembly module TamB domain-containing protein, partial [Anaeromyxobacteraceae bacterium]|nr:translocation/assembly module TamB domain-containing protein [Anaeromyxobacteraceae bacterium]